jgi:hypothetical protein
VRDGGADARLAHDPHGAAGRGIPHVVEPRAARVRDVPDAGRCPWRTPRRNACRG